MPSWASAWAMPRPKPRLAPVTKTTGVPADFWLMGPRIQTQQGPACQGARGSAEDGARPGETLSGDSALPWFGLGGCRRSGCQKLAHRDQGDRDEAKERETEHELEAQVVAGTPLVHAR